MSGAEWCSAGGRAARERAAAGRDAAARQVAVARLAGETQRPAARPPSA
jgi:hypothetical protein